jgi:hypothetical protein
MNSFSQSFEIIGYQAWPAHMQDRFVSLIPAMPPGNDQEGIAIVRQGIAELKTVASNKPKLQAGVAVRREATPTETSVAGSPAATPLLLALPMVLGQGLLSL